LNLTKDSKFIDDLINTASKTESTDPDFKTYQQGLAFPGYECKAVLRNITPPK